MAKDGLHVRSERPSTGTPRDDASLLALVSSARHELRSPLQAIQGFADLLASETYGALGNDQRVFVEHIMQGSAELSRALDACFELVQAELLHLPVEALPYPLRRLLEESFEVARPQHTAVIEAHLDGLTEDTLVEVDLHDFQKAVVAVLTALAPISRGPLMVWSARREKRVDVTFSAVAGERMVLAPLDGIPRRSMSARAMLWLRVAASLIARGGGDLLASEGYEQVRITMPARGDG